MSSNVDQLYQAALALPQDQRAKLAERLWASLSGPATSEPEEEFRALAEQWRTETQMISSVSKKFEHPAYRKIIAMGETALPLILRELRDRPGLWFEALRAISGQTPVSADEAADPRLARERWLRWGMEKGYIE